jgi:hypothetical protein
MLIVQGVLDIRTSFQFYVTRYLTPVLDMRRNEIQTQVIFVASPRYPYGYQGLKKGSLRAIFSFVCTNLMSHF